MTDDDPDGFDWWNHEGVAIGAAASGGTIVHCGIVHPCRELRSAYSMSPLCSAYLKADGTRLAAHRKNGPPMLVRNFRRPWVEFAYGARSRRPICKHCVKVWEARADRQADLIIAVDGADALEAM